MPPPTLAHDADRVEALAVIAKLHEELTEARTDVREVQAERDRYQDLWHRDAGLLNVALMTFDRIATDRFDSAEEAARAATRIRKERRSEVS